MRLLVDTDVLIDHLRGARRFDPGSEEVSVSVVTRAELYAGRTAEGSVIDQLLGTLLEVDVDRAVAERAGQLRRTMSIPIPDALIAATALEHGLTLLTHHTRRFERIVGLEVRSTAASEP